MRKIHYAFTLAEVLITLGIIGIVAAMTIPALMNNIQDSQFKQAWKKEFSTLSNATSRAMSDNGGSIANACSTLDPNCFRDFYAKYLNVSTKCDLDAAYGICWDYTNSVDHKGSWGGNNASVILGDGAFVMFYYTSIDCSSTVFGTNIARCANVFVDTNGFKGPNTVGKDIHCVIIAKNSVIPLGSNQITSNVSSYGAGSVWDNSNQYLYN